MYIEKISIKNFGALRNYECDYGKGVNVIEGPNEAGKSTLGEFIKFMFFGLSAKTDGNRVSERKKYQSFEDGSAGGHMDFESDGKRYRIERTIIPDLNGVGRETVRTIDLDSGEECLKDVDPGMYFFGVDGDVYTQTAYVSQTGGNGIDRPTVKQAIENMLFSGNELISTEDAAKVIEKEAGALLYKNGKGGVIYELGLEKDRLAAEIEEERAKNSRIIELDFSLKKLKADEEALKTRISEHRRELEGCEGRRTISKLDALAEKEKELREREEKKSAYISEHTHEGFIPDEEYVQKLTALASETEFYNAELEKAREDKKALGSDKIDADDLALINRVQSDGGTGGLNDFFENTHHKSRVSKATGVFFLIMTIIWGGLAAACIFIEEVASIAIGGFTLYQGGFIAIGIAFIFLVVSVICFIRSRSLSKKIDKKLESYNATSEDDIFVAINAAMGRASSQEIYIEKLAAAESACKRVEKEISTREDEIKSDCEKWGRTYEGVPSLRDIIKEAQDIILELSKLSADINVTKAERDIMKSEYASLVREDAERAVSAALTTPDDEAEKALIEETAALSEELAKISENARNSELELARIEASEGNTAELLDRYDAICHKIEKLTARHGMLLLALQTIGTASADLRAGTSPKLSMHAGEFMRVSTNDKYGSLNISPTLNVKYGMEQGGVSYVSRDDDYMSEGTRDIAYVSLRLALVGFLYKKELPPLVFDEAFARLDDKRLEGISAVIKKYAEESAQVFVLTSQKRDAEIIGRSAEISHIKMGY